MKEYLLPTNKHAYKANLHAHSNLSDGKLTPEQLAKAYREHGYSVLCITDHEFIIDHSDLNTDDFLLLTGYELQLVANPTERRKPDQICCHMCIYSKDPHDVRHVFFNPNAFDLRRLCHVPEQIAEMQYIGRNDVIKDYSVDLINEVVRTANENGKLVSYNHPTWSLETDAQYCNFKGFYAMEIYNNDCASIGISEYNPRVYDCMLRSGQRLGCVATDDCHRESDMFGGFTYFFAESLTYEAIIKAMENGDFYASTGPQILELSREDDKIYVRSTAACRIALTTVGRRSECVNGENVSEAVFTVLPEDQYFRITVTDSAGHTANSRAYFL